MSKRPPQRFEAPGELREIGRERCHGGAPYRTRRLLETAFASEVTAPTIPSRPRRRRSAAPLPPPAERAPRARRHAARLPGLMMVVPQAVEDAVGKEAL